MQFIHWSSYTINLIQSERVSDPAGVNPDPDPNLEEKLDP